MDNKLMIFENKDFGEIQIIEENQKYKFEATGIARLLGYANPRDAIQRHCKRDGVVKHDVIDNLGRKQEKNFISEGNLYRLITHSKLPDAEKFEKWVFDEILPSIRKTGGYIAGEENFTEDELILKAMNVLNAKVENLRNENKLLEGQIEEQKPKVLFANSVETSKTSVLIGELAKIIKQNGYDIGQKRLFDWLRNNGYLITRRGTEYNMPTQKSMNLGLFEIKESSVMHSDGHISISKTPKVTGKGQIYFISKFVEKQ